MRRSTSRFWLVAIAAVAAAAGSLDLEALTRARLPPSPSKRSRAGDTPVLPHAAGGGPDGGSVASIALGLTNPTRVFISLSGGGVYASLDHGVTWTPADRGLPPSACDLVADPVAEQTLYAACGDGLFKTTNGGGVWRQLDIDHPELPTIAPSDPRVLYQPPFGGLVRSRDGGRRWTAIRWPRRAQALCDTRITVDPLEASTLYCAGARDVLVSRDDGATWRPLPGRSLGADVKPISVAVAPANRRIMFVTTDDRQVLKTTTGGWHWTPLRLPDAGTADDVRIIDRDGEIVYARQTNRLVRSFDGGAEWQVLSAPWPADSLFNYAVDPRVPDTVYAGTSAGVFVSTDSGRSWAVRTDGITRASTRVVVHDGARTTLFASAGRTVFTSVDDGATWSPFEGRADLEGIDGSMLASDGDGGVVVRAGSGLFRLPRRSSAWAQVASDGDATVSAIAPTVGGVLTRSTRDQFSLTFDGGGTWHAAALPGGVVPSGVARIGGTQDVLVAGVGGLPALMKKENASLWRSTDRGQSWQRVRVTSQGIPTGCCRLFVDPTDADTVYAAVEIPVIGGGSAPDLLRSVDAGITWVKLQQPALSGAITILPTRPTTVLAQAYGGGLVRTTDRGDHWTMSAEVLPEHVTVAGFAFDPRRPAVVFAATDSRGVYRSADAGATWQPTGRVRQSP